MIDMVEGELSCSRCGSVGETSEILEKNRIRRKESDGSFWSVVVRRERLSVIELRGKQGRG